MNNFTKEELQHIRFLINNMNVHLLTADKAYILVQSKIQSMIDNYCDPDTKNRNLLIKIHRQHRREKWDLFFEWEGLSGCRFMTLEIERDGFSLPREGVEDIKIMCEEFLNNKDKSNQYLRVCG